MKRNIFLVVMLTLLLPLLACRSFIPPVNQTPTAVNVLKNLSIKSTATPEPSFTPTRTGTSTSTALPPSLTPTQITSTPTTTRIPVQTQLSIFEDLWTIVNDTYVYPDFNGLDWDAIHQKYRQKIMAGLSNGQFYLAMSDVIDQLGDDHSFFIDPQQVAEQEMEYQGRHDYVGIGVLISAVPARQVAVVLSVFPASPAEAAGLQPRDNLLAVDGIPVLDQYGFLQDIVRGPEGTTITIDVQTPGEELRRLSIIRQRIIGDYPLFHSVLTAPSGLRIGYIFLLTFEDSTVDEQVAQALKEMAADAPLDGLILDNRMNGGGSSTVLEPVLSYFTGGNLGNFVQHAEQRPLGVKRNDIDGSSQVPLVVLVGPETASFGEIFAGVLQDVGRAYLIGTTTGGNVEILWGYDLEDGSQLWLANETFRPLNHPDQDWEQTGIVPDLTVLGDFDQYILAEDPAVLAAIQYFSERRGIRLGDFCICLACPRKSSLHWQFLPP